MSTTASTQVPSEPFADDIQTGLDRVTQALSIPALSDEYLLGYRESVVEQKRALLDELSDLQHRIEAEIQARIERNGGRALLHSSDRGTVKAESVDQFSPYAYDVDGLRAVASKLPASEAVKVVKRVEEQVTVIPAHDEPGNPRSIAALIKRYGENSEIGKALSACMQRTKTGTKLVITVEPAR